MGGRGIKNTPEKIDNELEELEKNVHESALARKEKNNISAYA